MVGCLIYINISTSHPLWVRGLKCQSKAQGSRFYLSHPLWVRGLKSQAVIDKLKQEKVAPFMGAWIEIVNGTSTSCGHGRVAPFMGAWIEIVA